MKSTVSSMVPHKFFRSRLWLTPFIVLAIGLTLSFAVWRQESATEEARVRSEFLRASANRANAIRRALEANLVILESLRGFSQLVHDQKSERFSDYVQPFISRLNGVRALEWVPRIKDGDRNAYEASMRASGIADFTIKDRDEEGELTVSTQREEYFPISDYESGSLRGALTGFDLASDPVRRTALYAARDAAEIFATGRITLLQETEGQYGIQVFLPIYKADSRYATLEERRKNLEGFILGVFRVPNLVRDAFSDIESGGIDVHLTDESAAADERFLYAHLSRRDGRTSDPPAKNPNIISYVATLNVAGRLWRIQCYPTAQFFSEHNTAHAWWVLIGGILATVLGSAYSAGAIYRNQQLGAVNSLLHAEIRERATTELALRNSKEHFSKIFRESPCPLVIVKFGTKKILDVNNQFLSMSEYDIDELLGKTHSDIGWWVNPKESEQIYRMIKKCGSFRDFEATVRTKSGEHLIGRFSADVVILEGVACILFSGLDITEERRVSNALKKSEMLYRAIVQDQTELIYRNTPDRILTFVNDAYCRSLDKSRSELVGRPLTGVIHPEDQDKVNASFAATNQNEPVVTFEHRVINADGSVSWQQWTNRALFDRDGQVIEYQAAGRDITALKRNEETLRSIVEGTSRATGEDFLRSLVRNLSGALGFQWAMVGEIVGEDHDKIQVLAVWEGEEFGNNIEYNLKDTPCAVVLENGYHSVDREVQQAYPKDLFLAELGLESYIGVALHDSQDNVIGILSVYDTDPMKNEERDKSILTVFANRAASELERNHAEEAMKESEERYRGIFTATSDGLRIVSNKAEIVAVNPAYCRMLGYTEEEYMALDHEKLSWIHPDSHEAAFKAIEAVNANQPFSTEAKSIRKDGSVVDVEVHITPWNYHGKVHSLSVIRDITQRKAAEAAIQEKGVLLEVLNAAAIAANEAVRLEDAVSHVLERICSLLDWQVAAALFESADPDVDEACSTLWYSTDVERFEDFRRAAANIYTRGGTDVPTRIMAIGEPIWVSDIAETNLDLPLGPAMVAAGIRTFVDVPIMSGKKAIGVLAFHSTELIPCNSALVTALCDVGMQLGRVFERSRAEYTLIRSEKRYRDLVENANSIILRATPDGTITFINDFGLQFFGFTRDEIVGHNAAGTIVCAEDKAHPSITKILKSVLQISEEQKLYEHHNVRKNGERVWVRWANKALLDEDQKIVEILSVGYDVTDLKLAEEEAELRREQLVQADRLTSLGTLVAGVAHEINNPNSFIMMNVPILQDMWRSMLPVLDARAREQGDFPVGHMSYSTVRKRIPTLLDAIGEGAGRIKGIVSNLKDFSRNDTMEEDAEIDLNEAVKAAVTLTQGHLKRSTNRFSIVLADDLPKVYGSLQRVEQVIINLINNACEALPDTEHGIKITTSADAHNENVKILVEDEGMGIHSESMKHIYDPFYTTKRETGGTGLGLSISEGIIREHGGSLIIKSTPGVGTRVVVTLPRAAEKKRRKRLSRGKRTGDASSSVNLDTARKQY